MQSVGSEGTGEEKSLQDQLVSASVELETAQKSHRAARAALRQQIRSRQRLEGLKQEVHAISDEQVRVWGPPAYFPLRASARACVCVGGACLFVLQLLLSEPVLPLSCAACSGHWKSGYTTKTPRRSKGRRNWRRR